MLYLKVLEPRCAMSPCALSLPLIVGEHLKKGRL